MFTIFVFVLLELSRITKWAITTISNREPFSQLNPWLSEFWTRIGHILLTQVTIFVILRLFNHITSILRIPLTLTYTEYLINAMVYDIFQVGDAFHDLCYLDVVARLSTCALHRVLNWVPVPWFWRPDYFLGGFPIPLFAWYTGYIATAIYHSLYSVSCIGLPKDLCIGLCLLMTYLRVPGHRFLARFSPIELTADLRGAAITKVQAFIAVLAMLVFAYLKSANLQAATYYCLLWGTYLLRDPKLACSSPNSPLISSLDTNPELRSLQNTLNRALGVPISYLSILPVLIQVSGEPYMDLVAFLFVATGGMIAYDIYHLFRFRHDAEPTKHRRLAFINFRKLEILTLVIAALAWLYLRFTRFPLLQSVTTASFYLVQPLAFILVALASYFTYITATDDVIPSQVRTAVECIFQIGALLLTLFALPYLSFTVAFYAVAVPGLLLYFYYTSSATANSTTPTHPHGLQAVLWDEPVPAWAKHLWWIIPLLAAWESVQILQHYEAIHHHFGNYNSVFFFEAWASSSTSAIVAIVLQIIVTFLVHIVQERYTLEFLWNVGSSVTSYLPFNIRPLRDAILVGAGSESTYQGRQPTELIQAWIVLVLQAYRPGAWSLVFSMLVWDIIQVNKPPSEGSPLEIPVQDNDKISTSNGDKIAPSNDEIKLTDDQRAEAAAAAAGTIITMAVSDDWTAITDMERAEIAAEAAGRTISTARVSDQSRFATVEDENENDDNDVVEVAKSHDNAVKDEADAMKAAYLADEQARSKHPRRFGTLVEDNSADDFGLDPEDNDQMLSEDDDEEVDISRQDDVPGENLKMDENQLLTSQSSIIHSQDQPAAQKGSGPSM